MKPSARTSQPLRRFPAAIRAALWLALLAIPGQVASAHPILQNPVWIEVSPDALRVKLCVSLREFAVVQGASIDADGRMNPDEVADAARRHVPYLLDHLHFRADGAPLAGRVTAWEPPETTAIGPEGPDRSYYIYRIEYPMETPPAAVSFRQSMVVEFPSSPGVPWDFSYAYRFGLPGEPAPRQFGALPRDREVEYVTGFRERVVAEPSAADRQRLRHPPAIRGLLAGFGAPVVFLFWTVLALNFRGARPAVRMLRLCALAFAAGYAAKMGVTGIPVSLAGTAAGAGILLLAADNIHHVWDPPDRRRWILAGAFSAVQGYLAGTLPGADGSVTFGAGVLAAGATAFSLTALLSAGLRRRIDAPERLHPFMQIVSLTIAAAGVFAVARALDIRLWRF